jgi:glycosyltransferase involved in cell wall biosynthesis
MYRIGFVVNHPTQFEVPFYKYVHKNDTENHLDVFYLENNTSNDHFDVELGRSVKWGFDLYEGYTYHFLEGTNTLAAFEAFLKKEKYDLIIINGYKNQYSGFADVCRRKVVPVALRMDTVLFNQSYVKVLLRKLLLKKEYRKFDHFMVTGTVSKNYLHEMGIKDASINIFSYCIDNDLFNGLSNSKQEAVSELKASINWNGEKVILTVAKFMQRESPWDVLHAFTQLNRLDLMLLIVGDGEEREALLEYARRFPHLKIHFAGYIPYVDLPLYYNVSSLFIHAAKDEPWGVSVQEAIAGGCRVICSNKVGAAVDMVSEELNGGTYTFGDHQQLAKKIEQALNIADQQVEQTNNKILDWWNYKTMWDELLQAASRCKKVI